MHFHTENIFFQKSQISLEKQKTHGAWNWNWFGGYFLQKQWISGSKKMKNWNKFNGNIHSYTARTHLLFSVKCSHKNDFTKCLVTFIHISRCLIHTIVHNPATNLTKNIFFVFLIIFWHFRPNFTTCKLYTPTNETHFNWIQFSTTGLCTD